MAIKMLIVPYLPVALAVTLAFVIAACGSGQDTAPANTKAAVTGTAQASPPTPVMSSANELGRGVWAEVHSTGSCLNVRTAPSLNAAITGCQPDGASGQIIGGPEEKEGHRWWHIVMDFPAWDVKGRLSTLPPITKGWAAVDYLRFQSQGATEFKGFKLGDTVGDFAVEQIKILSKRSDGFQGFTVVFSGETSVEGEYQYGDECGWSFLPNEVSRSKVPRSQGLEGGGFFFRESIKLEVSRLLAPEVGARQSYQGIRGRATVVIANYVHHRAPKGCGGDFADLVRLVSKG